jgi:lipopolysaccharide transport system permease protein
MSPEPSASSSLSGEAALEQWTLAPDVHLTLGARAQEVWRYRRILWFFAVKAVQRIYANTRLGPFAFIIRSVVPVFAGSLVFGQVMNVPSAGVPYFLFLLTGSTIWNCFDGPLTWATRGLEMNRQLIRKLYLPRLILPLGQMSAGLVDPTVSLGVMVGSLCYYRYVQGVWYCAPASHLLVAPAAMILVFLLAFAISLWTSVWQARARDMRFVLAYVLGFWYLLTPVIYPVSHLPPSARWAAAINPMTGPVEAFKWAVLGLGRFPRFELALSVAVTGIVLVSGFWYFTQAEGHTIDRL